ncbi:MAG: hypothetical protein ACFFFG_10555 [Candidatus Thorarchaeota archaeon]
MYNNVVMLYGKEKSKLPFETAVIVLEGVYGHPKILLFDREINCFVIL